MAKYESETYQNPSTTSQESGSKPARPRSKSEIHDAMLSGKNCIVVGSPNSSSENSVTSQILNLNDFSSAETEYPEPYAVAFRTENNSFLEFTATSSDSPLLYRVEV